MKQVTWMVKCMTLVDVDDDDEAAEAVGQLFEGRGWPDDTGKCKATMEFMSIVGVSEAKAQEVDVSCEH